MTYQVKLEVFEGPLDLLLYLITKNQVDIFDIPIAKITDQFLEYLDQMEAQKEKIGAEFLVMAAVLVQIKTQMLLPGSHDDLVAQEDPRSELTRPLLEYALFRELGKKLNSVEQLYRDVFPRACKEVLRQELAEYQDQVEADLLNLVQSFHRIIKSKAGQGRLVINLQRYSVQEKTRSLLIMLRRAPISMDDLYSTSSSMVEFLVSFMAVLELIHQGKARLIRTEDEVIKIAINP